MCSDALDDNLFKNWNFESAYSASDWTADGCTLDRSTDAYEGQYSGQVTNRSTTILFY